MTTRFSIRIYACRLCSDVEFVCSVRSVTMPRQPAVTPAAPPAHISLPTLLSAHKNPVTSPPACSASLRRCTEWGYLRPTLNHTFTANHSSGSVAEMVAMVVSGTVSNVVGLNGTEARMSVQTAAMKVQWCVSSIDVLPTGCQPSPY